MTNEQQYVQVQNLTTHGVVYLIPEDNLRRVFGPEEEKKISVEELRKLYYHPGGATLIHDFLRIKDKELALEFGVDPDVYAHEYTWDKEKVEDVLLNGNIDVLRDALVFAPEGIVDVIVDRAVALRIADINKRELIQEHTGKNINQMINNQIQLEKALGNKEEPAAPKRRAAEASSTTNTGQSGRKAE